jgi:hypothetical protein
MGIRISNDKTRIFLEELKKYLFFATSATTKTIHPVANLSTSVVNNAPSPFHLNETI